MIVNMIGSFVRNNPFGTEIAYAKGLRDVGVSVNTCDPSRQDMHALELDADATIVFKDHGGDTYDFLLNAKHNGQIVIEYQPDDVRAPGIRGMMEHMSKYCDYAFTFDTEGARVAEEVGYKKAKKLLLTADPELYKPVDVKKVIDFCFIGNFSNPQMHESRRKMIELLANAGYNVYSGTNFDPILVNLTYNRSKVVLNHATDVGQEFGWGYGYQCRHFEAGFAGSCLMSNSVLDIEPGDPIGFCTFSNEQDILEDLELLLDGWYDGYMREIQGEAFREELLASHTPVHRAREIVSFIEEVRDEA